jgi:hypothetical protein
LVSGSPLDPMARFLFSVWQLRVSCCGVPSLTRAFPVIYSYNCFWALPEQSLCGPSPAEQRPYFTVSFETPSTWRARSPYLYPQEQDGPVIPPGTRFSFHRHLRLAGLWWRDSNPPAHGLLFTRGRPGLLPLHKHPVFTVGITWLP